MLTAGPTAATCANHNWHCPEMDQDTERGRGTDRERVERGEGETELTRVSSMDVGMHAAPMLRR